MAINYFLKRFLVASFFLVCIGCGKHEKEMSSTTIKVEAKPNTTTLYYTGTIKPISTVAVYNIQADGYITQKNFEYGDPITKGQLLFVITSQQLAKDFQTAFSDYVKAKKSLIDVKFQMNGAEYLKKLNIMSEQDYSNTKTQTFNAELDFAQAERRIKTLLLNSGIPLSDIENFKTIDAKAINAALARAPSSVKIFAPETGLALLPESDNSSSKESSDNLLTIGSQVKAGQSLLSIGNISGISVSVKITEIYVGQIKAGVNQKAIVTSEALPDLSLSGVVEHVDRQAVSDSSSSGIPTFNASIVVPHLTKQQQEEIRVGMSAEVAFPIAGPAVISVPLSAIVMDKDKPTVKIINPTTQKTEIVHVTTGRTDATSVEVTQGLKNGDEVVTNAVND